MKGTFTRVEALQMDLEDWGENFEGVVGAHYQRFQENRYIQANDGGRVYWVTRTTV